MTNYYAVLIRANAQLEFRTFKDIDEAEAFYLDNYLDKFNVHVFGDINGAYYLAVYTEKAVKK